MADCDSVLPIAAYWYYIKKCHVRFPKHTDWEIWNLKFSDSKIPKSNSCHRNHHSWSSNNAYDQYIPGLCQVLTAQYKFWLQNIQNQRLIQESQLYSWSSGHLGTNKERDLKLRIVKHRTTCTLMSSSIADDSSVFPPPCVLGKETEKLKGEHRIKYTLPCILPTINGRQIWQILNGCLSKLTAAFT